MKAGKEEWIEGHFQSWDKTRIFYRFFLRPEARHTVVMLHGYGEHSGRYLKFPERMRGISAQLAVMDLRGMGRSEGERGTLGSFEDYLRDISCFVTHLREEHLLSKQFILFGHSLGGLLAVEWALAHPEPLKTLILSAPFLGLKGLPGLLFLNRVMLRLVPNMIYKNPVCPRTLSHDPSEIQAYRNDSMILHFISARLIGVILDRLEALRKRPILSLLFPVYMLVAGKEKIVDPRASRRFFERLVVPYKQFTSLDGFFHEIFNEAEQQKAFNVLKTIIEDCV